MKVERELAEKRGLSQGEGTEKVMGDIWHESRRRNFPGKGGDQKGVSKSKQYRTEYEQSMMAHRYENATLRPATGRCKVKTRVKEKKQTKQDQTGSVQEPTRGSRTYPEKVQGQLCSCTWARGINL